jgi:hypothetical protein
MKLLLTMGTADDGQGLRGAQSVSALLRQRNGIYTRARQPKIAARRSRPVRFAAITKTEGEARP